MEINSKNLSLRFLNIYSRTLTTSQWNCAENQAYAPFKIGLVACRNVNSLLFQKFIDSKDAHILVYCFLFCGKQVQMALWVLKVADPWSIGTWISVHDSYSVKSLVAVFTSFILFSNVFPKTSTRTFLVILKPSLFACLGCLLYLLKTVWTR